MIYVIASIVAFYLFIVIKRVKKYKYKVSDNYTYNLERNFFKIIDLKKDSYYIENSFEENDTVFIKITFARTLSSFFCKPYLKIDNVKHYFEYGAKGERYINISHLSEGRHKIQLKYIRLKSTKVNVYVYKNNIDRTKKILILAPHADDAEIAAFGLYQHSIYVTIVTTTAGEHGLCNYCKIYNGDKTKQSLKKGKLRAFDAVTVPLLGGVEVENSIALGYFGGRLEWMYKNPEEEAISVIENINDMNEFRKVAHAKVKLKQSVKATYISFIDDLTTIVKEVKPDIILTSHPQIDNHPDHIYTTVALLDVLETIKYQCELLLYTNHLTLSETYPIGKIGSAITLPPNKNEFYFDSIYSYSLDKEAQIDKFFALEAIHDLRDSQVFMYIGSAYKYLKKVIKRKLTGKDKSYYKRAIRSNELFFVVKKENLEKFRKRLFK